MKIEAYINMMADLRAENEELKERLNHIESKLEAKLAESERKNFELLTKLNLKEYAPAFCTLADRDCEALGQIEELKHQLKVAERTTKLACDELRNLNYRTFDNADIDFEQQFKEQAEAKINK